MYLHRCTGVVKEYWKIIIAVFLFYFEVNFMLRYEYHYDFFPPLFGFFWIRSVTAVVEEVFKVLMPLCKNTSKQLSPAFKPLLSM